MITPYYTYSEITKRLSRADDPATIDGRKVVHPSAATYARMKPPAYQLANPMPPAPTPPEGKVAVFDGYEESGGKWVQKWRFDDAPPPPPKVYSTADAIEVLMKEEVWPQCRAWIEEQGLLDLVLVTKEFSSDLENFDKVIGGLQQLLGWSDEKVVEVLAQAEVG